MTESEWRSVEEKLSYPYGRAAFRIDGYNIDVIVIKEMPNSLKYVLAVYVDGKIRSEWSLNDCDIRRKFYCRRSKSLLTASDKNSPWFRKLKKSERNEVIKHYQYNWYSPYFSSMRSLKAHFLKNNNSIELAEA